MQSGTHGQAGGTAQVIGGHSGIQGPVGPPGAIGPRGDMPIIGTFWWCPWCANIFLIAGDGTVVNEEGRPERCVRCNRVLGYVAPAQCPEGTLLTWLEEACD